MYKFDEMLTAELERLMLEYTDNTYLGVKILTDDELRELAEELKTR